MRVYNLTYISDWRSEESDIKYTYHDSSEILPGASITVKRLSFFFYMVLYNLMMVNADNRSTDKRENVFDLEQLFRFFSVLPLLLASTLFWLKIVSNGVEL